MFSLIEIDSVLSPARRKLFHYFWVTFSLLLIFSTWKLWGGQTLYPQVPFLPVCTAVPHRVDEILRGLVCLSLVVMLLTNEESSFWRWGCLGFIIGRSAARAAPRGAPRVTRPAAVPKRSVLIVINDAPFIIDNDRQLP